MTEVKKGKGNGSKLAIYLTNFLTPSFIGFLKNTPKISEVFGQIPGLNRIASSANPYGAIIFGGLEMASAISDKIKNFPLTRLAKAGGAGWYGVSTICDLFAVAKGDYKSLVNLVFDGSMAYQLGKDTLENYTTKNDTGKKRDFIDDLTFKDLRK
jgi:hypothetical protein